MRRVSAVLLLLTLAIIAGLLSARTSLGLAAHQDSNCYEVVINGGFEDGGETLDPWVLEAGHVYRTDEPRHGGQFSVWMGGYKNAVDGLYQSIDLPNSTHTASLSYWWYMHTTDDDVTPYDYLVVTVKDEQGALLQELQLLDNTDQRDVWSLSSFDIGSYAGDLVRIHFRSLGNSQYVTSFFVDDVSVTVCLPASIIYLPVILRSAT